MNNRTKQRVYTDFKKERRVSRLDCKRYRGEMADSFVLEANIERCVGSSPTDSTVKSYPTIQYCLFPPGDFFVFDKIDGSNIRAEWSPKKGWHKFGTRTRLIDKYDPVFGKAPDLIFNKYSENLSKIFFDKSYERVICFFEFFGKSSFAGHHIDEKHDVMLIDVAPMYHGITSPDEFIDTYQKFGIPSVLHHGAITEELIDSVQNGTLKGMTFEGIIGKRKNDNTKIKVPIMFKHKNKAWLDKLKIYCKNNSALYHALR